MSSLPSINENIEYCDNKSFTTAHVISDHRDIDVKTDKNIDDLFVEVLTWLKSKDYIMGLNMSCTGLKKDELSFFIDYTSILSMKKSSMKIVIVDSSNVMIQMLDEHNKELKSIPAIKMCWSILKYRMNCMKPYIPSD